MIDAEHLCPGCKKFREDPSGPCPFCGFCREQHAPSGEAEEVLWLETGSAFYSASDDTEWGSGLTWTQSSVTHREYTYTREGHTEHTRTKQSEE